MPPLDPPRLRRVVSPTQEAPTNTSPATRRIDFLADFLASLRLQKSPRINLYTILCAVAAAPDRGMWQEALDKKLGEAIGSTCTRLAEQGFLTVTMRKRKVGSQQERRWLTLAPDGEALVAVLLNPREGKGLVP